MADPLLLAPLEYAFDDLLIRAYRVGDGQALQTAVVASYAHLRPWMTWAQPEQSVEESERTCRRFAGRYLLGEEFTLGIWHGPTLVGGTGYRVYTRADDYYSAEVGMWIAAAYAGQGLGTRVLHALLTWGFRAWPWQRLIWRCDTHNHASARVAEKGGLRLEGTFCGDERNAEGQLRDTYLFAILRNEWLSRQTEIV